MPEEEQKPDFIEATTASRRKIGSLGVMEMKAISRSADDKLTQDEFIYSRAVMKAYEVASKSNTDVAELYQKVELLAEKYSHDPKLIKISKAEFAELQKKHPDSDPKDGVIDIKEIAAKELEALSKAFPEEMKRANDAVQKEYHSHPLTSIETLSRIADIAQKSGRE